jgi:hypothetical protein
MNGLNNLKRSNMVNIEIKEKDCNGEDVYLEIIESDCFEDFLNCYAYRKVQKRFLFWKIIKKQYIHRHNCDLWDTRCNSYTTLSRINSDYIIQKVLIDKVIAQVNESIKQEEITTNARKLIEQFKKK